MLGKLEFINDIQIYYEMHGNGEPLVLLHGFTGSSASWGKIAQELSTEFQLIIPDMRGHGRSTNNSSTYTFRQVSFDIYALLDKLKIKKFKALGCSGGGNALLHMAIQQPDRIDSMVLVSATSYYPEKARAIMAQTSVDTFTEEQWQASHKLHLHGDTQIRNLYDYIKSFALDRTDMNLKAKDLNDILARTLIIQGDRDTLYPIDISVEMYKAIPQCALWVVPNAGHVPITAENTDYFIDTVIKFMKNQIPD